MKEQIKALAGSCKAILQAIETMADNAKLEAVSDIAKSANWAMWAIYSLTKTEEE